MEELWAQQAFMHYLGARLVQWGEGYGKVALKVEKRHLNNWGTVHGGVILALADGAFAISGASVASWVGVGAQVHLNILASPREGDEIFAESRVIHVGRRSLVVELSVSDGSGRLVAKGTGMGIRVDEAPPQGSPP